MTQLAGRFTELLEVQRFDDVTVDAQLAALDDVAFFPRT